MPLFLTESDVTALLTMPDAFAACEDAFRALGEGQATNQPRRRLATGQGMLHHMVAALPDRDAMGYKAYTVGSGGVRFHVMLYSVASGELIAILQANALGQIRTGAASGVATAYLAREDARRIGCIGTGSQARTQLEAVVHARPPEQILVFGRDGERRASFARDMSERLGCDVTPAESADAVVRGSDIVITATTSRTPVFDGALLAPGTHVNAIGNNFWMKQEIDLETVRRADIIVVDDHEQARIECGDLLPAVEFGTVRWGEVRELGEVVAGRAPGRRTPEDVTLFESQGIALEDIAVAAHVVELARGRGIGQEIAA